MNAQTKPAWIIRDLMPQHPDDPMEADGPTITAAGHTIQLTWSSLDGNGITITKPGDNCSMIHLTADEALEFAEQLKFASKLANDPNLDHLNEYFTD